jgi:hypothetical protein
VAHLFPSIEKAYQRCAKLRKQKKIRHIGTVQIEPTGRPRDIFYNGRRPPDHLLAHEYHLTTFCLLYPQAEWKRLYDTDRRLRPDAEMLLSGTKYFVELDTGTIRDWRKLQRRFRGYQGCKVDVLWVCLSETRMRNLLEKCDQRGMFFTTLACVAATPHGAVWSDRTGEEWSVE